MLLAAMILGLVGGLSYALGGASAVLSVSWEEVFTYHTGPPWWVVTLIPIGVAGAVGGALVYWKPKHGAALLFLATVGAVLTGLLSKEVPSGIGWPSLQLLPMHPFSGPVTYLPLPLFAHVIATALAMAFIRKPTWLGTPPIRQEAQSTPSS